MLVIRRRAGESVMVGAEIEIQIIEVTHNRVKLGITAPAQVSVVRKEAQLTREQNVAAARGPSAEAVAALLKSLHSVSKI
jgi:carbon storage regulator